MHCLWKQGSTHCSSSHYGQQTKTQFIHLHPLKALGYWVGFLAQGSLECIANQPFLFSCPLQEHVNFYPRYSDLHLHALPPCLSPCLPLGVGTSPSPCSTVIFIPSVIQSMQLIDSGGGIEASELQQPPKWVLQKDLTNNQQGAERGESIICFWLLSYYLYAVDKHKAPPQGWNTGTLLKASLPECGHI